MKYKIIGEKIIEDLKNFDIPKKRCSWLSDVDGKIVEFEEDEIITCFNDYLISIDWCEPVENVLRETICDNKNIIEKIKEYRKTNIKLIDDMTDAGFSTDVDTGICYAYGRILDLIEREEKTND